jgi:carbamoyl-phosphate synthase small subunit
VRPVGSFLTRGTQGPRSAPPARSGRLLLEDGTCLDGEGYGAERTVAGEVVFTTGMVGYPESLTDPSYRGQILTFTYPLLGNYGVPDPNAKDAWGLPAGFESPEIQVRAALMQSLEPPHHWNSKISLPDWARRSGVPLLVGIDTRRLTALLRSRGVMRGIVTVGKKVGSETELRRQLSAAPRYEEEDFVEQVTPRKPKRIACGKRGAPLVAVIDCGVKASILRSLLRRGVDVVRWPAADPVEERFEGRKVVGVLVGNGPGDPAMLHTVVSSLKDTQKRGVPVLGICLGQQLLAEARGGRTFKLKFGHRGQNKPAVFPDGRAYILSENHGYAVDPASLKGTGLVPWAFNPDDGTLEGMRDERGRVLALQGHPEGGPGPREAGFVFDQFVQKLRRSA